MPCRDFLFFLQLQQSPGNESSLLWSPDYFGTNHSSQKNRLLWLARPESHVVGGGRWGSIPARQGGSKRPSSGKMGGRIFYHKSDTHSTPRERIPLGASWAKNAFSPIWIPLWHLECLLPPLNLGIFLTVSLFYIQTLKRWWVNTPDRSSSSRKNLGPWQRSKEMPREARPFV